MIDDYQSIVESISLILEDCGYEVTGMSDGNALYNKNTLLPDLILIDMYIHEGNSSDICKYLKSKNKTKDIPIILMSGDKDVSKTASEIGVDDYLSKPFGIDQLIDKVARYIK